MRHDGPHAADGTQPPGSSSAFTDPLAGLVGGQQHGSATDDHDVSARRASGRHAPDPEKVRSVLNGVFAPESAREDSTDSGSADDSEKAGEVSDDAQDDAASSGSSDGSDGSEGSEAADGSAGGEGEPVTPVERPNEWQRPGMLPLRRRTWPARRRVTRQAWRPRRRHPARGLRPTGGAAGGRKPGRGSAGVAIAIALLLLFCFVAIELVVSLLDTLSGIGG